MASTGCRSSALRWGELFALAFFAAPDVGANSAWLARVWQSDEGLPENTVTGIVQTPEGYLWVATHDGLVRFDGARFQPAPLPRVTGLPHRMIRTLLLDHDERLWLGLEGGVVARLSPGRTNIFLPANSPANATLLAMAQDREGAIWLSYGDGSACRIRDDVTTRFTAREGLPGIGSCWVVSDDEGRVWFAKAGRVGLFRDEKFITLLRTDGGATRIARARGGGIWICAGRRLFRFTEGAEPIELDRSLPDQPGVVPTVLMEDRGGALWIGTAAAGLFRRDAAGLTRVDTSHGWIRSLAQDREGNVWAGTGGGGLNRLRPRMIEWHGTESGLPFETVRSLCEDAAGHLWAAGENGVLARRNGETWTSVSTEPDWPGGLAACVAANAEGDVWVGTYRHGLYRVSAASGSSPADLQFTTFIRRDGLAGDSVRALCATTTGDLWLALASPVSLQRLRDDQLRTFRLPSEDSAVRAMVEDTAGRIWMGTADGALFRVDGDELTDETARTLEVSQPIRGLCATPDGSVWIAYGGAGVGRFKGDRFARIGTEHGLPEEHISQIVADGRGWLWFAGNRGIFQVRRQELDDVAEGRAGRVHPIVYGRNEGLTGLQATFGYAPVAIRDGKDRVWLPMRTGLAVIHTDRVRPNRMPPPVLIERVLVDNQALALPGGVAFVREENTVEALNAPRPPALRVASRHRKVEFEFTALSFVAPENVHFKYRLEGLDDEWTEADAQRSVSYSRLPAGDYHFFVTACNNAGVWNEIGAGLAFVVPPVFWQTWPFRALVLAAFTVSTIFIVRYVSFRRLRRKLRLAEQETALHRDRARIAKDIHDDLGANLTQIALLSELAQNEYDQPAQAREHIDKIFCTARALARSVDEIVWAVNPKNDTLDRWVAHLCAFAPEFLRAAGVRCRLDVPMDVPLAPLPSKLRHHLHLAAKESLHNIVKHAGATEVWLRLTLTPGWLTLVIEDNGQGFRPGMKDGLEENGLANLRQRMSEIGGRLDQRSQPGQGTVTTFIVPVK